MILIRITDEFFDAVKKARKFNKNNLCLAVQKRAFTGTTLDFMSSSVAFIDISQTERPFEFIYNSQIPLLDYILIEKTFKPKLKHLSKNIELCKGYKK